MWVCVCVCCIAKSQAYEISHTLQRRALFIKAKALSLSLFLSLPSPTLFWVSTVNRVEQQAGRKNKNRKQLFKMGAAKNKTRVWERERNAARKEKQTHTHTDTREPSAASRKSFNEACTRARLCDRPSARALSLAASCCSQHARSLSPHARSLPYLLTAATPYHQQQQQHSNDGGRRARELSVSFTARNRPAVENFERIRTRRT